MGARTPSVMLLLLFALATTHACIPPDCDRPDNGSCLNACCKLSWKLRGLSDPLAFAKNVSALLKSGGSDGRFTRYDNKPVEQMWSVKGTYVVQGHHVTAKGTYTDLVQIAVEASDDGLTAYGFSHSQDLIDGEFAYSDFGQNYKNLALIIKGLGVSYKEDVMFGCPESKASSSSPAPSPPPLPAWAVAAWKRDFEKVGPTQSSSLKVYYVQATSLFSDCRVPKDRPARLKQAKSMDDYNLSDLQWLAESHGFAGGTIHKGPGGDEDASSSTWKGNLTWHHVLTDYANTCANPSVEWPEWLNGTHHSGDRGAIEVIDAKPSSRILHEHGYPVDTPVVQYEQWRALTPQGAPDVAMTWPKSASTPHAMLLIVGSYFAYARDRPVHGDYSTVGCSLRGVLRSSKLSLEQKRQYADAELSFGTVAGKKLTIVQSTLPFREGKVLGKAELCRGGAAVSGDRAVIGDMCE